MQLGCDLNHDIEVTEGKIDTGQERLVGNMTVSTNREHGLSKTPTKELSVKMHNILRDNAPNLHVLCQDTAKLNPVDTPAQYT